MLTNEDRKQILAGFLDTIEGISNKEYQKRVWIRGEGPEVDDFTETTCHFFDEGDSILEEYRDFGLTNQQYKLLIKFRGKFRTFSDLNDFPEEFIDTAEWAQIIEFAKEVLSEFNNPTSESEILRKKGKPLEGGRKNHFGSQMR
jgi:hypothetical protein